MTNNLFITVREVALLTRLVEIATGISGSVAKLRAVKLLEKLRKVKWT